MRMAIGIACALAALTLGFSGCGDDDSNDTPSRAAEGTYVGRVSGSNAYIALVSDGKRVAGYVCDGTEQGVKVYAWLKPTVLDGRDAELVQRDGATLGTVELSGDEASGEVEISGQEHAFEARLAQGDAGLYRAAEGRPRERGSLEAGWIVLADGSQRGGTASAQGTVKFNTAQGTVKWTVEPAPGLDPAASSAEIGGATFGIDRVGSGLIIADEPAR